MTPWIRWDAAPAPAEPAWRWLAQCLGMPALLATPARPPGALAKSGLPEKTCQALASLLGEDGLRLDDASRLAHAAKDTAGDLLKLRGGDFSAVPDAAVSPRSEDDVLAVLRLCAEADIAIGIHKGAHAALLACDLSRMTDILSLDALSGLATVQAGISSAALARQLAARGMSLGAMEFSTLGDWIAGGSGAEHVVGIRLAAPQGLLPCHCVPVRNAGIVTAADLRIRPAPAVSHDLHYLFPDFASGLTALREMAHQSGAQAQMRLWDAQATRLYRRLAAMAREPALFQRLRDRLRGTMNGAAALTIRLSGGPADVEFSRKRLAAIAGKLGARPCGGLQTPDFRDTLMDRGVTVDQVRASASWSKLPVLYAALRGALDQAMRRHAPRHDANGLVLFAITGARHDGAELACTFLYPRQLNTDVAQAYTIRQAALDVLTAQQRAESEAQHAIRALLDPKGILAFG